jgi:hypothetical protein
MTLEGIKQGVKLSPVKVNIYGPNGIGKSTWASQADNPIFICTEDGVRYIDVDHFELSPTYQDVLDKITMLGKEDHSYKTIVIDSTDFLESLIHEAVCEEKQVPGIEALGYGKGYTESEEKMRRLLRLLDRLQQVKKMNIILVSHAAIRTFADPEREPYDRWELITHKKISNLIRNWVDFNFFANHEISTTSAGKGFNEKARAVSYGKRALFTQFSAAFDAKSRVALPNKLPLEWDAFYSAYKEALKPKEVNHE